MLGYLKYSGTYDEVFARGNNKAGKLAAGQVWQVRLTTYRTLYIAAKLNKYIQYLGTSLITQPRRPTNLTSLLPSTFLVLDLPRISCGSGVNGF